MYLKKSTLHLTAAIRQYYGIDKPVKASEWRVTLTHSPYLYSRLYSQKSQVLTFDIESDMISYPSAGGAWRFDADGDSLVKKRADCRPFVNVGTIGHVDQAPVKFKGNLHIKL